MYVRICSIYHCYSSACMYYGSVAIDSCKHRLAMVWTHTHNYTHIHTHAYSCILTLSHMHNITTATYIHAVNTIQPDLLVNEKKPFGLDSLFRSYVLRQRDLDYMYVHTSILI